MSARPFAQTPWQTVGPFFHYALPWKGAADLLAGQGDLGARLDLIPDGHDLLPSARPARASVSDEAIEIVGRIFDGAGEPLGDALIEIWQADPLGCYAATADASFLGFGRAATTDDGGFRFRTLRPGRVPGPKGVLQAPHIAVSVLARGLLKRLVTRIYFAGEAANAEDPVLALVPEDRRHTLIAQPEGAAWRFDIRLQGDGETVFFEI